MAEGVGVSDEQLDEWERLAAAASPAPWFFAYSSVRSQPKLGPEEKYWNERADDNHTYERLEACESCGGRGCSLAGEALDMDSRVAGVTASYGDTATGQRQADADFIAAAREALPALIGEVRASRAREAELLAEKADWQAMARVEVSERLGQLRAERDVLQQRIDKALDVCDKFDPPGRLPAINFDGTPFPSAARSVRAALTGTGDTE